MAPRTRKTPAPLVRARRTEEPDVLGSAAADPAPTTEQAPAATTTPKKRAARPASSASAQKAAVIEEPTPVVEPPRGGRKPQTVIFDVEILDRARAAVTHLAAYQPEANIKSLPDLVNPALATIVDELERKYNDGKPFRRVVRMQTGRPAGS